MPIGPLLLRSAPIVALLVNQAPELVNSARRLYETIKDRNRSPDPESPTVEDEINHLRLRLDESESNITSQAELSSQLATQLQALHTRQNVILLVAGIALVISIVSVILVII